MSVVLSSGRLGGELTCRQNDWRWRLANQETQISATPSGNPSTNKGSYWPIRIFRVANENQRWWKRAWSQTFGKPNWLEAGARFIPFTKPDRSMECILRWKKTCGHHLERLNVNIVDGNHHFCAILRRSVKEHAQSLASSLRSQRCSILRFSLKTHCRVSLETFFTLNSSYRSPRT